MAPTRELAAQIARVLDALLPGSGLRGSLLSSSTAAGTDFAKVLKALFTCHPHGGKRFDGVQARSKQYGPRNDQPRSAG